MAHEVSCARGATAVPSPRTSPQSSEPRSHQKASEYSANGEGEDKEKGVVSSWQLVLDCADILSSMTEPLVALAWRGPF